MPPGDYDSVAQARVALEDSLRSDHSLLRDFAGGVTRDMNLTARTIYAAALRAPMRDPRVYIRAEQMVADAAVTLRLFRQQFTEVALAASGSWDRPKENGDQ